MHTVDIHVLKLLTLHMVQNAQNVAYVYIRGLCIATGTLSTVTFGDGCYTVIRTHQAVARACWNIHQKHLV